QLQHIFVKLFNVATSTPFGVPSANPGTDYTIPNLPIVPGISQEIIHEELVESTLWQQVVVCFTADADYDRLWIYPYSDDHSAFYATLYIDRVQLAPFDPEFAGDDHISACGETITIGQNICLIDNLQFQWTPGGIPIGNGSQIDVNVIATTVFQEEIIFPLNPPTVTEPAGGNNCPNIDDVVVTFTGGINLNFTNIIDDYCNLCQ
ncbi:unnamed protein product, partial [marine sediment metagenome]